MADVFGLVICVALFIIGWNWVGGASSGRKLGAEDLNCKGPRGRSACRP